MSASGVGASRAPPPRLSGGFATDRSKKEDGGLHSRVIPCLTGNTLFSLIRLGLLDDPRLQAAIDWLTT
jgi:hypothetical protein